MKVNSIYPGEDSEKAISNYTKQLIKSQIAQGIKINPIEYTAGDCSTLRLDDVEKGDVIHIQHEYNLLGMFGIPFFFLYDNLGKRMKCKVITTMHNVLSQKEKFSGNLVKTFLRKTLYRFQNRTIRNNSDIVIVHADFFKRILVDEYNFPEEKVVVLRQGIQEDVKLIPKKQAKKELGLEGKVYLIIGSLIPDHGADIIIKQAKEIGGTILIVGNNRAINDRNDTRIMNWLDYLTELANIHKAKNVRLDMGEIPYELWWKYFAAADVVLLPYRGGIGSGIFSDCIVAKKPMVTSNTKYFRESEKYWRFVDMAESMKTCGNNVSSRCDYAQAIKNIESRDKSIIEEDFNIYTKEHGLTNLAKKYKEIYKND